MRGASGAVAASRRIMLLAGLVLVVAGAAIALIAGLGGTERPRRPAALVGPRMPANFHAAAFALHDQEGRAVRLGGPRDHVVVMTFLHSLCKSTCPVTAQVIRGALDDLSPAARRSVEVFAITVAPHEDTRRHVRAFLREQRVGGFMRYLTGPPAAVRRLWKRYGIHPLTAGEDHSAFVLLVDRRGIVRVGFSAHEATPEDVAHDLRILVGESA